MTFSNKRGRRRLNTPKVDRGTPQLRQKKQKLHEISGQTPEACHSLLGLLWAHHKIDQDMYNAGLQLQELYHLYQKNFLDMGWSQSSYKTEAPLYRTPPPPSQDFPHQRVIYRKWRSMNGFLQDLGDKPYKAVMKVSLDATPYENLSYPQLEQTRFALFHLDNWLRLGNHAKVVKKVE